LATMTWIEPHTEGSDHVHQEFCPKDLKVVGLDVHKDSIASAVRGPGRGTLLSIVSSEANVRLLLSSLSSTKRRPSLSSHASPTGYELARFCTES